MIHLLAQMASPAPADLGIWLGCSAAVMIVLNQGAALIDRFRPHPPAHEVYVTKAEHRDLEDRVDAIGGKIEENYNKIMEKSAESRSRMHKEIGDIATSVHRIEGKLGI